MPNFVPILTYHGVTVVNNEYAGNDHVALASDLELLSYEGWEIVPLRSVVDWVRSGERPWRRASAITFDDGSWFDFHDLEHPTCGPQRSLFNILRDFRDGPAGRRQPRLHASSFVIASPIARAQLDARGLVGRDWWGEDWWAEAQQSGLMSVESHSWDHVHPDVDDVAQFDNRKGDFSMIDTLEDCEAQVRQSVAYIRARAGDEAARLFAYPYGQASDYLSGSYLPRLGNDMGLRGAVTTEPRPVEQTDDPWRLPRFVCGRDWSSPEGLQALLRDVASKSG